MADITPLNITTAIATTAPPVPPAEPPAAIPAIIQSLPPKLEVLTRQVQVNGPITTLLDNGFFTLRTPAGDLSLKLAPLADGSRNPVAELLTPIVQNQRSVNVIVQPGSPPTQALVFLPPPTLSSAPNAASGTGFQTAAIVSQPIGSLSSGLNLSAVVLPSSVGEQLMQSTKVSPGIVTPSSQASPASLPSLATASPALLSSLKSIFAGSIPPQTGTTEAGSPATTAAFTTKIPIESSLLKPGAELLLKINTILPPNASPPSAISPDQFFATVIGKGAEGQVLLSAGDTTLYVRQSGDLPVGSRLLLTLLPKVEGDFTLPQIQENQALALQQAITILNQLDPVMTQQIMQMRIPQTNANLPGILLFFFNAFQQNGVPGWLGNTATNRLGKSGKSDVLNKLIAEMQQAGGMAYDPTIGTWRSYPLPIYNDQQFHMLNLYVHQDHQRQQQQGNGKVDASKTRFLINMNMSRLGALQLDGLSQRKQLDMIIRSERALPAGLPDELRGTYTRTLEALGLTGNILFQTGRKNWIVIQRGAAGSSTGVVT